MACLGKFQMSLTVKHENGKREKSITKKLPAQQTLIEFLCHFHYFSFDQRGKKDVKRGFTQCKSKINTHELKTIILLQKQFEWKERMKWVL